MRLWTFPSRFHATVAVPSWGLILALGAVGASLTAACGRSSPSPCRVHEGLRCEDLVVERQFEQADFTAAVAAADGDAASEEGACMRELVREQFERACIPNPCVELCALTPCPLAEDAAGASCPEACAASVVALAVTQASLELVVQRAAERPGLCSCAACDATTAPLCDALWACSP